MLRGKTFSRNPEIISFVKFMQYYSSNFFSDYNDLLNGDKNRHKKHLPTGTCTPFSLRLYITCNGDILPCEHIDRKYKIGKIEDGNVDINEDKISNLYNGYYNKIRKLCVNCYNYSTCLECMFTNNTITKDTVNCDAFMNYTKSAAFLSEKISFLEDNPLFYKKIIREGYDG